MEKEKKNIIRIILLGDTNVGKTRLLLRYFDRGFTTFPFGTIGLDCRDKNLHIENKNYNIRFFCNKITSIFEICKIIDTFFAETPINPHAFTLFGIHYCPN